MMKMPVDVPFKKGEPLEQAWSKNLMLRFEKLLKEQNPNIWEDQRVIAFTAALHDFAAAANHEMQGFTMESHYNEIEAGLNRAIESIKGEKCLVPITHAFNEAMEYWDEGTSKSEKFDNQEWMDFFKLWTLTAEQLISASCEHLGSNTDFVKASRLHVDYWLTGDPRGRDDTRQVIGSVLSLLVIMIEEGEWPKKMLDEWNYNKPDMKKLCEALAVVDSLVRRRAPTPGSADERVMDLLRLSANRLGRAIASHSNASDMMMVIAGTLSDRHDQHELGDFLNDYLIDDYLVSRRIMHWVMISAAEEYPVMLDLRNEDGHTILSLYNQAFKTAKEHDHCMTPRREGWDATESALIELLDKAEDVQSLVQVQDPLKEAASLRIRSAIESKKIASSLGSVAAPLQRTRRSSL